MNGAPWICPRCGTPTNTDVCPQCLHERPFADMAYHRPGSPFSIAQGPQGYLGLPRSCGISLLIVLGSALLSIVLGIHR